MMRFATGVMVFFINTAGRLNVSTDAGFREKRPLMVKCTDLDRCSGGGGAGRAGGVGGVGRGSGEGPGELWVVSS